MDGANEEGDPLHTWKTAEAAPKAKPAVTEKNEAKPTETESAEPKAEEAAVEEETETKAPEAVEVSEPDTASTEESTAVEQPAAQEETPAVEEKPSAPSFDTIEDARLHLLTHARQQVVKTVETVRFHGRLLAGMQDSEIKRAVIGELERQRRFPLDTANGLRGRLRREHFTIFKKGSKGISYVCAVKRKFRVPGQTFADSIGELISFIETHPMIKVSELSSKFAGVETTPKESKEGEPAAEPELTVDQKAKISRMQGDLRWLVMEGYVTEFIDGRLFAAPPIPESKKKAAEDSAHDTESYPDKPAEAKPEPVAAEKSEKPAVGEPATEEAPKVAETTEAPSEQADEPAKPESTPPVKETENSQKNTESETVQEEATSPEKKPESPSSAE